MDPKFLKYIKNDNTYLEQEPLKDITKNQLLLMHHVWQCMDSRDKEILERKIKNKEHID